MIKFRYSNDIFYILPIKMKRTIKVFSLKQLGLVSIPFFICCLGLNSILATFGHNGRHHESFISRQEKELLKEEARDMFYHAYRAYMENAYPADELMPLSCHGRWRDIEPNRGDIDDSLGNFSLTLIDSLDTLVILGDYEEFDHAVGLVVRDVSFDSDVVVSVFETNIRVLGGLLSAHILAEYVQQESDHLHWYKGELLAMAKDLGFRLLPAFNTSTGIPHARINLKHGLKTQRLEASRETCTACAGTMILELAALSRLTGESIFEEKAQRAMDELWRMRHRSSDLMGTVLNIHSGDWVRRDSGVGAGIDSYYEYCLKAYILLGDEKYLGRFNKHYSAVMKYISQGPLLLDVHMHRPHTNSRNFMDALLAFWPGLQVLKGDLRPAVETHEMLYQVIQRHNFIPEAFTTDFQVHWGQHPLRPEFLESTYFLYRATNDPYYLEVGRTVLRSLQKYARVPCGYAAVQDVRTGLQEDRMDSFVLAETFKYLFLLFADPSDLPLDLDQFLFTTEAHLLPLSLARQYNYSSVRFEGEILPNDSDDLEFSRTCPNTMHLFPASVRRPLRNMVAGVCPRRQQSRRLHAADFQAGNPDHLRLVKDMGISILTLPDGRVQLLHTFASARSSSDAEEGLLFMQEMVELAKSQALPDSPPQAVTFTTQSGQQVTIQAGPAHFGRQLVGPEEKITGRLAVADPARVCDKLTNEDKLKDRIVIMERGDCMFVDKARRISKVGAIAGIVMDNTPGTSANNSPMFAMSGDGKDDVKIPVVFLFYREAMQLLGAIEREPALEVTITELSTLQKGNRASIRETNELKSKLVQKQKLNEEAVLEKLRDPFKDFLIKQDIPKDSVGASEVTQVDVGEFHASVEASPSGLEMIRISRRRGNPSNSFLNDGKDPNSQSQEVKSLGDEPVHTQPSDLGQIKEVWIKELAALANDKRSAVIPAPILKLYHQMMNNKKDASSAKPIWTGDESIQLQIAWLLGELTKANGPTPPPGTVTNAKTIDQLLNERMKSVTDNTNIHQLADETDQLISIKRRSLEHQDSSSTSEYKSDDRTTSETTPTPVLLPKDEL